MENKGLPLLMERLPPLLERVEQDLPSLIDKAKPLLTDLAKELLPDVLPGLIESSLPSILDQGAALNYSNVISKTFMKIIYLFYLASKIKGRFPFW